MRSTMMDVPLLVPSILRHAALYHGDTEIVSRTADGTLRRTTYSGAWRRVQRLANALAGRGLRSGDRVGTLAWNSDRHFEIYYAAAGAGFVCHTINPRLFPDQIRFIIADAADRILFVEADFLDLVAQFVDRLPTVEAIVVLADADDIPATAGRIPLLCYEDLLAAADERFDWPALEETAAAGLCYTSGTTGNPKGVLYSHRSMVLHAMAVTAPDVFALGAASVVMPVVPMFHVNAWGLPHAAPLVGAKLVLPGPKLDGASLGDLIASEGVSFSAGVPTVWTGLLDWAEQQPGGGLGRLDRVGIGGSACPPVLADRFRAQGVEVVHAWGMTETSPVGLANRLTPNHAGLPPDAMAALAAKQGRPLFGVEVRIVGADGAEVPRDGVAFGSLQVRGPWVAAGYLNGTETIAAGGWFDTGDVATMDTDGYVQIVDRTKDVIKSGGEWISSIELEHIALSHPAVREAAVVARPDARWGERPLLVVVLRDGAEASEAALLAHYSGKVARWWVPDAVVFAGDLPHTATGKLLKTRIRERYGAAPTAAA